MNCKIKIGEKYTPMQQITKQNKYQIWVQS